MSQHDPWTVTLATLLGEHLAPVVAWPDARRRVIACRDWLEDLPELAPEPRSQELDERVLRELAAIGRASVRVLAGHSRTSKSAVARALQRLVGAGLVHRDEAGFAAV